MTNNNFLQVGQMSECSKCHPEKGYYDEKLIFKEHGIKCNCICHLQEKCKCNEDIECSVSCGCKCHQSQHEKQCVHDKPLEVCEDCDVWVEEFNQEFIKWADDLEELKKALKGFIYNLVNKRELPPAIGVSQWMNYGKKYHYWQFFEKRAAEEYWKTMVDILDGQFPKHKCKERGRALVMLAYIKMMMSGTKFNEEGEPIR